MSLDDIQFLIDQSSRIMREAEPKWRRPLFELKQLFDLRKTVKDSIANYPELYRISSFSEEGLTKLRFSMLFDSDRLYESSYGSSRLRGFFVDEILGVPERKSNIRYKNLEEFVNILDTEYDKKTTGSCRYVA